MFEKALGMYIYADTPVHTGSGIEINSPRPFFMPVVYSLSSWKKTG